MSDGKTRRYMNEREWQCFEDGVKYERERVIKLLEEHPCFSLETCQQGCFAHDLLVANIALIKGEK